MRAYQLNPGGTRERLEILRRAALKSASNANPHTRLQAGDWRGARHWTLKGYESAHGTLSAGRNGSDPVWYSHAGEYFRNEKDAHDIIRLGHTGYYTDGDIQDELAIGIVAGLSHGRFLAGYRLTMNDERVYFGEIFDDESDAARMADEHARIIGERESEHAERWREAQSLSDDIESAESEIDELRAEHTGEIVAAVSAEHVSIRAAARIRAARIRAEVAGLIASIRDKRETLATDYRGIL